MGGIGDVDGHGENAGFRRLVKIQSLSLYQLCASISSIAFITRGENVCVCGGGEEFAWDGDWGKLSLSLLVVYPREICPISLLRA